MHKENAPRQQYAYPSLSKLFPSQEPPPMIVLFQLTTSKPFVLFAMSITRCNRSSGFSMTIHRFLILVLVVIIVGDRSKLFPLSGRLCADLFFFVSGVGHFLVPV